MLAVNEHPARLSGARWAPAAGIRLGQISDGTAEIEQSVNLIASDLERLSGQLLEDLALAIDMVGPETQPWSLTEMTQNQTLKAIDRAAEELAGISLKMLQPPLGPYVTPASAALLESVNAKLADIRESAAAIIIDVPIFELQLDQGFIDNYTDQYVGGVTEEIRSTEESVVRLENENIPVYEESEKAFGFWKVVTVGGVLVGLIALGLAAVGQGGK